MEAAMIAALKPGVTFAQPGGPVVETGLFGHLADVWVTRRDSWMA
jgi:hypothetical protein